MKIYIMRIMQLENLDQIVDTIMTILALIHTLQDRNLMHGEGGEWKMIVMLDECC